MFRVQEAPGTLNSMVAYCRDALIMITSMLRKRIAALEHALARQFQGECNCRCERGTAFHNAAELARILKSCCAAHGFRDLGHLTWVPVGLPLQPEDQEFCSCSRSAIREFVEGRRGPLSDQEREELRKSWDAEFTDEAAEKFRSDQLQVRRLLSQYERARRMAYAESTAMPRQDKRR